MKLKHLLIALAAVFALTACRSTKDVGKSPDWDKTDKKTEAAKLRIAEQRLKTATLTAKMKVRLNALGQQRSLNGTLRMKRDEVMQMSLTVLGFEVARAEFTPDEVLLVDRFNKRYARCRYDEVNVLKSAGINFDVLQAVFWNELFIPGEKNIGSKQLRQFGVRRSDDDIVLMLGSVPPFSYDFHAKVSTACINRIVVRETEQQTPRQLVINYEDFESFNGKEFPREIEMALEGAGMTSAVGLSHSRLSASDDWESRTNLSSKYKQLTTAQVESLVKSLLLK